MFDIGGLLALDSSLFCTELKAQDDKNTQEKENVTKTIKIEVEVGEEEKQ